eukprot:gene12468-19289_t
MASDPSSSWRAHVLRQMYDGNASAVLSKEVCFEVAAVSGWFVLATALGVRKWMQRSFLDTVNCSLNVYDPKEPGKLFYRTLSERQMKEFVPSAMGRWEVTRAASRTTRRDDSLVRLSPGTAWLVNNAVANQLSSLCAGAFLARDLGNESSVRCDHYVICLTAECTMVSRMHKIRAMVIKESSLIELSKITDDEAEAILKKIRLAK